MSNTPKPQAPTLSLILKDFLGSFSLEFENTDDALDAYRALAKAPNVFSLSLGQYPNGPNTPED